jgi:hypothetical protein
MNPPEPPTRMLPIGMSEGPCAHRPLPGAVVKRLAYLLVDANEVTIARFSHHARTNGRDEALAICREINFAGERVCAECGCPAIFFGLVQGEKSETFAYLCPEHCDFGEGENLLVRRYHP